MAHSIEQKGDDKLSPGNCQHSFRQRIIPASLEEGVIVLFVSSEIVLVQ